MSHTDPDKSEFIPRPHTETDLVKLIENIKNEIELSSSTCNPRSENTNYLLISDKKHKVPQSPGRTMESEPRRNTSIIGKIER